MDKETAQQPSSGGKRDRLLAFWVNEVEQEAVDRLAASLERTRSDTLRYLVRQALRRTESSAQD